MTEDTITLTVIVALVVACVLITLMGCSESQPPKIARIIIGQETGVRYTRWVKYADGSNRMWIVRIDSPAYTFTYEWLGNRMN